MQVRARALKWTQKAVGIEFTIGDVEQRTWVWRTPSTAPRTPGYAPIMNDREKAQSNQSDVVPDADEQDNEMVEEQDRLADELE